MRKINNEVIAVISATLECYNSKTHKRLVVRNIRRIHSSSPVWNTTGRMERIAGKL